MKCEAGIDMHVGSITRNEDNYKRI